MNAVSSILVVVDRSSTAADAVSKAVMLARRLGARIKLFTCDAERGFVLSQAYIPTGVEDARRASIEDAHSYLMQLKEAAAAPDVSIVVDAGCESPLYESVVRKVLRERPDLVIKNAAGSGGRWPVRLDATDWQLMRTCPATLMLTRGRPWQATPRFAAAIDASDAETAGLARDILKTAQLVKSSSNAELEVIYAEPDSLGAERRGREADHLNELIRQVPDVSRGVQVLAGNPEERLPGFARQRAYDAIFLGALTHRPGLSAQVGTLTSKLIEAVDCDFVLVKPDTYRTPVSASRMPAECVTEDSA